ncbi:unnamed protein product [Hydatigera taeniaeformis]|uniref:G_PROTEIN_RECEP_F1_2 domain-containing protein n=1 Tax=Hydatigena taeniaeformis TaxID=6205 RepID=A0A158REV0_HYDTA|nr:unnamed protein product [Hydatigera taeniaeformis]
MFMRQQRMNYCLPSSTRLILSCIAAADVGYLSFMLIFCLFHTNKHTQWPVAFALLYCGFNIFEIFRNWLLIAMSFERFLFFLKPVKFKLLWSLSHVRIIVICIAVGSVICRIPDMLLAAALICHPLRSQLIRTSKLVHIFMDLLALACLPIVLMLVFSFLTTKTITDVMHKKFLSMQAGTPVKNAPDNSIKIVSILRNALIVFVITSLPAIPSSILRTYLVLNEVRESHLNTVSGVMNGVTNLLSIINSTSNFFIYVCQSRRYRGILVECLCSWCHKGKTSWKPFTLEKNIVSHNAYAKLPSSYVLSQHECRRIGHTVTTFPHHVGVLCAKSKSHFNHDQVSSLLSVTEAQHLLYHTTTVASFFKSTAQEQLRRLGA